MIEQLCQAIQEKRTVIILYKGHDRIVEPHLIGRKRSGNDALSAWQIGGYSESNRLPPWRNYLLSEIENIQVLDQTFDNPRDGFNPNDKTMSQIYCHV